MNLLCIAHMTPLLLPDYYLVLFPCNLTSPYTSLLLRMVLPLCCVPHPPTYLQGCSLVLRLLALTGCLAENLMLLQLAQEELVGGVADVLLSLTATVFSVSV
jgi:hypothetical protein